MALAFVWEWMNDALLWKPFQPALSHAIEAAFQAHHPSLDLCIASSSAPSHSITFQSHSPCQVLHSSTHPLPLSLILLSFFGCFGIRSVQLAGFAALLCTICVDFLGWRESAPSHLLDYVFANERALSQFSLLLLLNFLFLILILIFRIAFFWSFLHFFRNFSCAMCEVLLYHYATADRFSGYV